MKIKTDYAKKEKNCNWCGSVIGIDQYQLTVGRGKLCSVDCALFYEDDKEDIRRVACAFCGDFIRIAHTNPVRTFKYCDGCSFPQP